MGKKYRYRPEVGFSSSPTFATTVGIVSITEEYIQCNGMYGGMIDAVDLVNAGCGYTVEPMVVISPSGNDIGTDGEAHLVSLQTDLFNLSPSLVVVLDIPPIPTSPLLVSIPVFLLVLPLVSVMVLSTTLVSLRQVTSDMVVRTTTSLVSPQSQVSSLIHQ